MDWPNETILEFLDHYKNEPIIWNPSFFEHKNRHKVYDAWKIIELKMGNKYSVSELKKKKDFLMASFRSCYNRVKQSVRSGASAEDVYKPSWFAYEKMAGFLKEKDQLQVTIKSEDISSEEAIGNDELQDEDIDDNMPETGGLMFTDPEYPAMVLPSKRKRMDHEEELGNGSSDDCRVLEPSMVQTPQKNVCDVYGELIATKLKLLDEHCREICMHYIDNICFETKMNCTRFSKKYCQNDFKRRKTSTYINQSPNLHCSTVLPHGAAEDYAV